MFFTIRKIIFPWVKHGRIFLNLLIFLEFSFFKKFYLLTSLDKPPPIFKITLKIIPRSLVVKTIFAIFRILIFFPKSRVFLRNFAKKMKYCGEYAQCVLRLLGSNCSISFYIKIHQTYIS